MSVNYQMKKILQHKILDNEKLKNLVYKYYYKPDKFHNRIVLNSEEKKVLKELEENGLVKVPWSFETLARYINETYCEALIKNKTLNDNLYMNEIGITQRNKNIGTQVASLSFTDLKLKDLYFNRSLIKIIYHFFKTQPYYREQPAIVCAQPTSLVNTELSIDSKFHIDYYKQTICMLLLEDLTIDDTHLEYAVGSNNTPNLPWNRNELKEEEIISKYPISHAIGKQGDLFIVNTGEGIHRAKYISQTSRRVMFLTFTAGHYLLNEKIDTFKNIEWFNLEEEYIQKTVDKVKL